jgi:hypothetical protein
MTATWLIWVILLIFAPAVGLAAKSTWYRLNGKRSDWFGHAVPWQWDAVFLCLGVLGIVTIVPAIIYDQPTWAIDHFYHLVGSWRTVSLRVGIVAGRSTRSLDRMSVGAWFDPRLRWAGASHW